MSVRVHSSIIADRPPSDGRTWDCQCARCGSSAAFDACDLCCGDGFHSDGETDVRVDCPDCEGNGGSYRCLSSADWCELNSLPERDDTPSGAIEWFTFDAEREGGAA